MKRVVLSKEILSVCPDLCVFVIHAQVKNSPSNADLWEVIDEVSSLYQNTQIENINKEEPIFSTRKVYKALGKDPNRYRPSAEALRRRIVRGIPLYKIDTLVDIINLVSIRSGYSIGGFDMDKIIGGKIELGVGKADEVFEGIGRGSLNIEFLPVYRDEKGGIGTPTSDEERTKIELTTSSLLLIINGYSGRRNLYESGAYAVELLKKYTSATDIFGKIISALNNEEVLFNI